MKSHSANIPPEVVRLCQRLQQAGYATFLVGGSVRDALRGEPCKDYDLATAARPEQVQSALADPVRALHQASGDVTDDSLRRGQTENAPRVAGLVARAIRAREPAMLDVWFASLGPVTSRLLEVVSARSAAGSVLALTYIRASRTAIARRIFLRLVNFGDGRPDTLVSANLPLAALAAPLCLAAGEGRRWAIILPALDAAFTAQGYIISNTSTVGNTPAALGNRIFQDIRDTTLELRVEPARQFSSFFDERARQLRETLDATKAELEDSRAQAESLSESVQQSAEQARGILRHALKAGLPDRQSVAIACDVLTRGLKARGNPHPSKDFSSIGRRG